MCNNNSQTELEIFATETAISVRQELVKRDSILLIVIVLTFICLMLFSYNIGYNTGKLSNQNTSQCDHSCSDVNQNKTNSESNFDLMSFEIIDVKNDASSLKVYYKKATENKEEFYTVVKYK